MDADIHIFKVINLAKILIHQSYFFPIKSQFPKLKIFIFLGFTENRTLAIEVVTFLDTNICSVCM